LTPARLRAGVVKVGLGQPCLNGIGHSWRHASAGRKFCSGRDRPTIQHPYTTLPPAVAVAMAALMISAKVQSRSCNCISGFCLKFVIQFSLKTQKIPT
jgi:hypothetical protein